MTQLMLPLLPLVPKPWNTEASGLKDLESQGSGDPQQDVEGFVGRQQRSCFGCSHLQSDFQAPPPEVWPGFENPCAPRADLL